MKQYYCNHCKRAYYLAYTITRTGEEVCVNCYRTVRR